MMEKEKLWNSNYVKVWLANFMIFFSFMIVTPLLPLYLSDTFQADKDTIGFILSGYTLTALLARPIAGYLVDSYSPSRSADMLLLLLCPLCWLSGGWDNDSLCHHPHSPWRTHGSCNCG